MTPAQLHATLKTISRPHITRSLRELQALGLVKLLNPDTPRYHLYQRAAKGSTVAKEINVLRRA